jgi:hypothetical protein
MAENNQNSSSAASAAPEGATDAASANPTAPLAQPEPAKTGSSAPKGTEIPDKAATEPRHSIFYLLFSPQTRVGRVMRPTLRWLGAIVGLFALGALSAYLLIYKPTLSDLESAQSQLQSMQTSLAANQKELQTLRDSQSSLQKTITQGQADLKIRAAENDLLTTLSAVQQARVSLAVKDGAAAKTAIELAQASLARALPQLTSLAANRADVLKTRLDLAAKELAADPTGAQTDLEKVAADLIDIQQSLFSK